MFTPARMREVSVLVHRDAVERTLSALHETGHLQLSEVQDEGLEPFEMEEGHRDAIAKEQLKVSRLLEILRPYAEPKPGLIQQFISPRFPERKPVKLRSPEQLQRHAASVIEKADGPILENAGELERLEHDKAALEERIQLLEFIEPLGVDTDALAGLKRVEVRLGRTSQPDKLAEALADVELAHLRMAGSDDEHAVLVVSHPSAEDDVRTALKGVFQELSLDHAGCGGDALTKAEKRLEALDESIAEVKENLADLEAEWGGPLRVLGEELSLTKQRLDVRRELRGTKTTVAIKGWVPDKEMDAVNRITDQASQGLVCGESQPAGEDAPIRLENPGWARPFETIVSMYSYPKYTEFDPTFMIAIFFTVFFGFMLGDAGYGIIIIGLSIFGLTRGGRVTRFMRDWSVMGLMLGTSTTIIGFLTGSVFGDTIPRFFYAHAEGVIPPLYNYTLMGVQLPYDGVKDPMGILGVALLVGLVCLNFGILLGAIQNLRTKKVRAFFTDQVSWVLLQIGGGALIMQFLLSMTTFSDSFLNLSYVLVLGGLLLIGIDKKAMLIFDLSGYVGDWLSFARLMGLGLSTAIIAISVNLLAVILIGIHPALVVVAVILIIFGNVFNALLSVLGAFIHSLRLHYVELFSKFYEGGGKPFTPFRAKRRYTTLEGGEKK